jgi:hypothetical protein
MATRNGRTSMADDDDDRLSVEYLITSCPSGTTPSRWTARTSDRAIGKFAGTVARAG